MLHMNMRLGEGSGATLAFPILDAACLDDEKHGDFRRINAVVKR